MGVVVALAVTDGLAHAHVPVWWFLPVVVTVLLTLSLRRATRRR